MHRFITFALLALSSLALTVSASAQTYDVTTAFAAGWTDNTNPNGVWSYGWSTNVGTALTLYPNRFSSAGQFIGWQDLSVDQGDSPSIDLNTGGDYNNGNVVVPAGTLTLSAGGQGVPRYSNVVFTAPANGNYSITAGFRGNQYNVSADVHVLGNGAVLYSTAITSEGQTDAYSGTVPLLAGQTVEFAFGGNGATHLGRFCTGLTASITYAAPIGVKSLKLSPNPVAGSTNAKGAVTLTAPATAGGTTVTLASANSGVANPTAASITIPAGSKTGTFSISTTAVSTSTPVSISASAGGITKSVVLTVETIGVKSVTLLPSTVMGMNFVIGVVTLQAPAAPGDITVTLSSSDPAVAILPITSLTIENGYTEAAFSIYTGLVTSTTQVKISATANNITASRTLTIKP